MRYDLSHYRRTIVPQLKSWFVSKPDISHESELGTIAIATDCPIVVVGYLLLETFGPNRKLASLVKRLETFYKVTEVKGKRKKDK